MGSEEKGKIEKFIDASNVISFGIMAVGAFFGEPALFSFGAGDIMAGESVKATLPKKKKKS